MNESTQEMQQLIDTDSSTYDLLEEKPLKTTENEEPRVTVHSYKKYYYLNEIIYWVCTQFETDDAFKTSNFPKSIRNENITDFLMNLWDAKFNSKKIDAGMIKIYFKHIFKIDPEKERLEKLEKIVERFFTDITDLGELLMLYDAQLIKLHKAAAEKLGLRMIDSGLLDRLQAPKASLIIKEFKEQKNAFLLDRIQNEES